MRPILIVEDNDHDLELLLLAMEMVRLDNPVLCFRDGQEALDYLLKQGIYAGRPELDPEFMLLDLKMPRFNGFELLEKIRASEGLRRLPVIALTSSAQDQDLVRAYDLGVSGYVVKPVEFSDLMKAIESIGGMWGRRNEIPPSFRLNG